MEKYHAKTYQRFAAKTFLYSRTQFLHRKKYRSDNGSQYVTTHLVKNYFEKNEFKDFHYVQHDFKWERLRVIKTNAYYAQLLHIRYSTITLEFST